MIRDVVTVVMIIGIGIIVTTFLAILFGAFGKELGFDVYHRARRDRRAWLLRWRAKRELRGLTSEDFEDWTEELHGDG